MLRAPRSKMVQPPRKPKKRPYAPLFNFTKSPPPLEQTGLLFPKHFLREKANIKRTEEFTEFNIISAREKFLGPATNNYSFQAVFPSLNGKIPQRLPAFLETLQDMNRRTITEIQEKIPIFQSQLVPEEQIESPQKVLQEFMEIANIISSDFEIRFQETVGAVAKLEQLVSTIMYKCISDKEKLSEAAMKDVTFSSTFIHGKVSQIHPRHIVFPTFSIFCTMTEMDLKLRLNVLEPLGAHTNQALDTYSDIIRYNKSGRHITTMFSSLAAFFGKVNGVEMPSIVDVNFAGDVTWMNVQKESKEPLGTKIILNDRVEIPSGLKLEDKLEECEFSSSAWF